MNYEESKQLQDTISNLISKANAWDSIDKFFNTNKEIEEIYKEVRSECTRDGNYGQQQFL